MIIDKKTIIILILSLVIVILSYISMSKHIQVKYNSKLIDSLNSVIKTQHKIDTTFIHDTIYYDKVETVINTEYETIYKEFSNRNIISDDSIMHFISNKIHNKK